MKYILSFLTFLLLSTSTTATPTTKVTLRDKIGQMLLIGFDGKKVTQQSQIVKNIQENNIGGVILFDYNASKGTPDKNIGNAAQVKRLNSDLQKYNQLGNQKYHRPHLPLLISVDYEGGRVNRLNEKYGFPKTYSAAEVGTKSLEEAKPIAIAMANTLKEAQFNLDFAPVLDVNVNPDNPVIGKKGRSFSSDASKVVDYAAIYSHQFLKKKIQCAYKHFPGHGSSTQDSHLGFVDITDTWQSYELEPYQQLINAKDACGLIMTAHIVNRHLDESGLPATLSHKILTELLHQQMNYNGVIITDDMQMKAISDNYGLENAVVLAVNAGADMLLFSNNLSVPPQDPSRLINLIESKVLTGEISETRINEAYQRISQLKQTL